MSELPVLTRFTGCVEGLPVSQRLLREARLATGEGSGRVDQVACGARGYHHPHTRFVRD